MKTCVSTYSFGRYFDSDRLGIEGTVRTAAEMGFDAIEFTDGDWMKQPDVTALIKNACAQYGITLSALCVGADFVNRPNEVERLCSLIDLAAEMGASLFRHDITYSIGNHSFASVIPEIAPKIYQVSDYAASKGIRTMTENHGYISQDADRVEALISAVGHPNFGALIDIGNFLCADEFPPESVAKLLPYAVHIHAKDFFVKSGCEVAPGKGWFTSRGGNYLRGTIIGHGDAAVSQSLRIIQESGYDGYITVEFEGMEDALTGIRLGLDNLRRFWGAQ